jgi:hypothetical protein
MTMALWVLQLNDIAIRATRDGELVDESPGVAIVDGHQVLTGSAAAAVRFLEPRAAHDRYWQRPGEQPRPGATRQCRHHADLVYHHLGAILARCGKPREAVLAVPAHYGEAELAQLLGICEALGLSVPALVDSSVAALAACAPPGRYTVAELYRHHATLVDVDVDQSCTRGTVTLVEAAALARLEHACLGLLSDAFLDQARFDPLHDAASEQRLADALPGWLAEAAGNATEIEIALTHGGRSYTAHVARREFERITAMVLGALAERVPSTRVLVVSPALAALPGATRVLGTSAVLPPNAAAHGVAAHRLALGNGAPTCFVTALPASTAPTLARHDVPAGATDAPTHLLCGPRALPLGSDTCTLNADGSLGGGDATSAATVRCVDGRVLARPGRVGLEVNGRAVRDEIVLAAGDYLRSAGAEFRAIRVD